MSRIIKGSRVAVVGGAGFIGSHVANLLQENDCEVHVLDDLSVGRVEHLHVDTSIHMVDIRDPSKLRPIMHIINPHFVFNYAAHPYIPTCYEDPKKVFDVNAYGAVNVITVAKECPDIRAILQVSSAEVYGDHSEDYSNGASEYYTALDPLSTYAAAKLAVDVYCRAVYIESSVPVIVLRQFNCIGARETHPYVLPEIISQLHYNRSGNTSSIKLGNNTRRDFMDVRDAASAAIRLMELGELGGVYNLGSSESYSIRQLAEITAAIMSIYTYDIKWGTPEKVRKNELWKLQSDNTKILSTIGKFQKHYIEDAIKYAYEYFVANGYKWSWEK